MKIATVSAYAWEILDNPLEDAGEWSLCHWASPTPNMLLQAISHKPSPEARIVKVRMMREADYRKMAKAAKEAK